MAEPQIQDQPSIVTVHSAGVEGAPVASIPEQSADHQVEVAPELQNPNLSEDLQEAGVRHNPATPPVPEEAVSAGLAPSIPENPDFAVPDFQTPAEAKHVASQGPVTKGVVWQATEWLKNALKLKKAA